MSWQVRLLDQAEYARWDAYVRLCPQASFFHRAGWRDIMEQEFGYRTWYMYAEQQGQIGAVLPLALIRAPWSAGRLISLPFCVLGGIAATDEAAASMLDAAAQQLAGQLSVHQLELRHRYSRHPDWPRIARYASFQRTLSADHERNLLAIPRKQRAMIRKGESYGLQAVVDSDTDRLYRSYAHSVHRLGTPVFSARYFQRLQQVFGADCHILSIERQGKLLSSVLSFRFGATLMPYYAGSCDEARPMAAHDFMYWKLMQHGAESGATLFDFGRSKTGTGAYAYKKNWGFEAQTLEYDYRPVSGKTLHEVQPLTPRYQLAIRCWQRLPLALANRLGPRIIRYLG